MLKSVSRAITCRLPAADELTSSSKWSRKFKEFLGQLEVPRLNSLRRNLQRIEDFGI